MTEQLLQENEALKARLTKAAEVFREQKAQIEDLNKLLTDSNNMALSYKNQIDSLQQTLDQASHASDITIKTSDEEINKLLDEISKLKVVNTELNEKYNKASEDLINERSKSSSSANMCDALDAQLIAVKENNDTLTKENEQYKIQLDNALAKLSEHETVSKNYNDLVYKYDKLLNEYDNLNTKYANDFTELNANIDELKHTIDEKNISLQREDEIITSLKKENFQLTEQVKTLSAEKSGLSNELTTKTQTFDSYKKTVEDSDKELAANVRTIVKTLFRRSGIDYPGLVEEPMMQI